MRYLKPSILFFLLGCNPKQKIPFSETIVNRLEEDSDSGSTRLYHNGVVGAEEKVLDDMFLTDIEYDRNDGSRFSVKFFYKDSGNPNKTTYLLDKISSFYSEPIKEISDFYGHKFDFEKREYAWKLNGKGTSSLIITFDELGQIINKAGSINVDNLRSSNSKEIEVLFTTAFHNLDSVFISSPNSSTLKIEKFIKYRPLPLVRFLTINLEKDSIFYLKTMATEITTLKQNIFYDTLK